MAQCVVGMKVSKHFPNTPHAVRFAHFDHHSQQTGLRKMTTVPSQAVAASDGGAHGEQLCRAPPFAAGEMGKTGNWPDPIICWRIYND